MSNGFQTTIDHDHVCDDSLEGAHVQIGFLLNCNRTHTQTVQAKPPEKARDISTSPPRRAQDSQVINCCCGWNRNPNVHSHITCFANFEQTVQRKSRTRQPKVSINSKNTCPWMPLKLVFELVVRESQHRLCGGEHAEPKDHIARYSRVIDRQTVVPQQRSRPNKMRCHTLRRNFSQSPNPRIHCHLSIPTNLADAKPKVIPVGAAWCHQDRSKMVGMSTLFLFFF